MISLSHLIPLASVCPGTAPRYGGTWTQKAAIPGLPAAWQNRTPVYLA